MSVIEATTTTLCKYRRSLDAIQADPEFDTDDAATLDEWMASRATATGIAAELRRAGYNVSATTVKDHRRGECACRVDI